MSKVNFKKISMAAIALSITLSLAIGILVPQAVSAQDNMSQNAQSQNSTIQSPSSQSQIQTVQTEQYTGQLTKRENNVLFITRDNVVNQYNIISDIKIKRDGTSSSVDKLQAGDALIVTQNKATKELLSVDVVSKGVLDNSMVALASLLALLIIGSIVYYLYKKSQKNIIRTTTNTNQNY